MLLAHFSPCSLAIHPLIEYDRPTRGIAAKVVLVEGEQHGCSTDDQPQHDDVPHRFLITRQQVQEAVRGARLRHELIVCHSLICMLRTNA